MTYSLAVDIGGTFTDIVLRHSSGVLTVDNLPDAPGEWIADVGLGEGLLAPLPLRVSRMRAGGSGTNWPPALAWADTDAGDAESMK